MQEGVRFSAPSPRPSSRSQSLQPSPMGSQSRERCSKRRCSGFSNPSPKPPGPSTAAWGERGFGALPTRRRPRTPRRTAFAFWPSSFETSSVPKDSCASEAQGVGSHLPAPRGHAGTQSRTFHSRDLRDIVCAAGSRVFPLQSCTKGCPENTHCCKAAVQQAPSSRCQDGGAARGRSRQPHG